jgi:spore coat protein U-like protein
VRAPYFCILVSALILCIGEVRAAPSAGTLSVSTTVAEACKLSTAPMVFAPHVPVIGAQSGSTTLRVTCSTGGPFNVDLDGRQSLTNGSYTLHYSGSGADPIMVSIEY